jgi:hypothetical protein
VLAFGAALLVPRAAVPEAAAPAHA